MANVFTKLVILILLDVVVAGARPEEDSENIPLNIRAGETGGSSVIAGDPFAIPIVATQLDCGSAAYLKLPCDAFASPTCWINWVSFSNTTKTDTPLATFTFQRIVRTQCLSKCLNETKCLAFSTHRNGTCKLFSTVDDIDVTSSRQDDSWSLVIKYNPSVYVLEEWIYTAESVPVGTKNRSLATSDWGACLKECIRDGLRVCVAVSYGMHTPQNSSSACHLYSISASSKQLKLVKNVRTLQHVSLFQESTIGYRYRKIPGVRPMTPTDFRANASDQLERPAPPLRSWIVENTEECLRICYRDEVCQLVSVEPNENVVRCNIYARNFTTVWIQDKSLISYVLLTPKDRMLYVALPTYLKYSGYPISKTQGGTLAACHELAEATPGSIRYNYADKNGSKAAECTLFSDITHLTSISSNNTMAFKGLSSYGKILFQNSTMYLPFVRTWAGSLNADKVPDLRSTSISDCLSTCLGSDTCFGFLAEYNIIENIAACTYLDEQTVGNYGKFISNNSAPITQRKELFVKIPLKVLAPNFETKYNIECSTKATYIQPKDTFTGNDLNVADLRQQIIPSGGSNKSIEPNGNNFAGTPRMTNRICAVNTSVNEKTTCNLRQNRNNIMEPNTSQQGSLRIKRQIVGSDAERQIVEISLLLGAGTWGVASLGGPAIANLLSAIVIGAGVIFGNIVCWIASWFGYCQDKKEKNCFEECQLSSSRRGMDVFLRQTRPNCFCWYQPQPRHVVDDIDNIFLQENCIGKVLLDTCSICCRVGYYADPNPVVCTCVSRNSAGIWAPPAVCREITCGNDGSDQYNNIFIPLRNCQNMIYHVVSFNRARGLPFYSAYEYQAVNALGDFNRSSDFTEYPCTQIVQFNNYGRSSTIGGNWIRGHLTPHADMRYFKDAVRSTFYYINVAPQDKYSNGPGAWGGLEDRIRSMFLTSGRDAYIITGTCRTYGNTSPHSVIPDCFWKLICTRTPGGETTAGGLFHTNDNALTTAQKTARKAQVQQVHDPSVLGTQFNIDFEQIWREFAAVYPQSGYIAECATPRRIGVPFPRSGDNQELEDLYKFWHDGLFGKPLEGRDESEELAISVAGAPPPCGKRVVGYVTSWSSVPFQLNAATYVTHVIFAFVEMRADGSLLLGSADAEHSKSREDDTKASFLRMYEIKSAKEKLRGQGLKTMFAVGGWENSQYFSSTAASDTAKQSFITSVLTIIDYFDMDGVDIDWEYPVGGGAIAGVKEDKDNYVTFLRNVRSALNVHQREKGRSEPYLLSIAGAAGSWVLEPGYDLKGILDTVDFINVMTYDYFGAWTSKWGVYTGPIAPLYVGVPKGYSGKTNVDYTMKYYTCRGGRPDKLNMGLGFYGRFWNNSGPPVAGQDGIWRVASSNVGGYLPWREIFKNYLNNGDYQKNYHEKTQTPYLTSSSGMLLAYEDRKSMLAKVNYAAANNFGGVMLWALDLDDEELTLLRTASSGILCGLGSPEPQYKCSPIQERRWWTPEDGDGKFAGICGKRAPLYNGFYPVCDPEDPEYSCCSRHGYCGSGDDFCKCPGCVDYFNNPEKILNAPTKPTGPVRWHTLENFTPGPQCGYNGKPLNNGQLAICNPDDEFGYCCSDEGYCGTREEFPGCMDFQKNPNFVFPPKTWSSTGKCGYNPTLTSADYILMGIRQDVHQYLASTTAAALEVIADLVMNSVPVVDAWISRKIQNIFFHQRLGITVERTPANVEVMLRRLTGRWPHVIPSRTVPAVLSSDIVGTEMLLVIAKNVLIIAKVNRGVFVLIVEKFLTCTEEF